MSQTTRKFTKRLNSNIEVGKFSTLVISAGTYVNGADAPSGANVGPIAGVADESILPESTNDYVGGQYQIVTGTAWPSNSIPSSAIGRRFAVVDAGVSKAVAASAINVGDEVNIADSQGRLKTVNESPGTIVYIVGRAKTPATQANDVFQVVVDIQVKTL